MTVQRLVDIVTWSAVEDGWLGAVAGVGLLALLALVALFQRGGARYAPGKAPHRSLQRAFRVERFRQVVAGWADVRPFKRELAGLDTLFPWVYGISLSSLLAWLRRDAPPAGWEVAAMAAPLVAMPFDWLENLLHLRLLRGVDRPEQAATARFPPGLVAVAATLARVKTALLGFAALAVLVALARLPLDVYAGLFSLRVGLLFTALLVLLPLAALGWPAAAAEFVGNLLVGLHPAKPLAGRGPRTLFSGDVLVTCCWLFGAAWSAMFTWSLVARSARWERTGIYDGDPALVTSPQAAVFTSIALLGAVVVVAMARPGGRRGTRAQALIGAGAGAAAAAGAVHLLALPVLRADAGFLPLALPTFERLAGRSTWAVELHAGVSRCFASLDFLFRDFLFVETSAGTRLRPDHYFATVCTIFLALVLAIGFVRNHRGTARLRPAAAYVLTLGVFLVWAVLAVQVRLGTWSPILLVLLLWLAIPGRLLPSADHYFGVRRVDRPLEVEPRELSAARRPGDDGPRPPLVVACASGGGILAAGWATWVLARLVERDRRLAGDLRLVSGASGGSVGFAFLLERLLEGGAEPAELYDDAHERSVRSSLAAAAFGLAYADLTRFLSLQLTTLARAGKLWDRGLLLQRAWYRNSGAATVRTVRADPGLAAAVRERRAPVPIYNATALESGQRVMITPLRFSRPRRGRARTLPELLRSPRASVDVWTAVRLSATFPFVSPATRALWEEGLAGSDEHLVDAGYHDNFGISSALDALEEVLAEPDRWPERIALVEIEPFAAPDEADEAPGPVPFPGWAAAALGPLAGLVTSHFAAQRERNRQALARFARRWRGQAEGDRRRPLFEVFRFEPLAGAGGPTSWHLTPAEKRALQDGWEANPANRERADRLVGFLYGSPVAGR
ncbi:MAG: patatin-like phospholipase family protein [Thermoanaerobaculia bacterium]|nr:patatin-like phospholipase family protein [Thermoanaerobaculia bacterium]